MALFLDRVKKLNTKLKIVVVSIFACILTYVQASAEPFSNKNIVDNKKILAEEIIVKGKVVNENNEPIAGAVYTLKGTAKVGATNDKGLFEIALTFDENARGILVITCVGYNRAEERINRRRDFTIELSRNISSLSDVIVTSSYTKPKRKEEVVGSIVSISNKELQTARPLESFDKMLEGLAAGVQVERSTELGTPIKINIRGQNALSPLNSSNVTNLTTSSQPLFVIDGVPIIEQRKGDEPIAFLNNEQLLNPIAGINPADIESISILKDAAATSIYGANASNGVIIITTKKGKAGKTKLNIGYSSGWSQPINKIKWLDGFQYHTLVKEMYLNDGRTPFEAELLAGSNSINTPWFELVNRYATYNNIDIDLSGGNESTRFRLSGAYKKNEAIQKGNDYEQIQVRLNVEHSMGQRLSMSVSIAPTFTKKNALNLYNTVPIIPNAPSYNADGSFFKFTTLIVPNPLAVLDQNLDNHRGGSINSNTRFEYKILKNLTLSTTVGIDGLLNKQNIFDSPKNATGETKNGFAQIYDRTSFGWISSTQANWRPVIKTNHTFDITTGFEARAESINLLRGTGTGFTYYRLNELSNASSQTSASSKQKTSAISVYGQAGYNYKSKYNASISGRYDAASIFGSDVNSTVNAAIGVGWIISKERFLEKTTWLDMLRLRASYGTTGNARIGSYQARGLYSFSNSGYNGAVSSSPSSAPNPDLGWEKSFKTNIGLDINFLKRFNFTLDVYNCILQDGISPIPIPAQTGFTSVLANVGKTQNEGMDAGITAQIFNGKFKWTSNFNIGYNKSTTLELKNKISLYGASTEGTVLREGVSTTSIWGFNFAGIDATTGRELYYDKDGKITPVNLLDRSPITGGSYLGDRLPKAQGGFINSFGYKGFSLTVNFVYSFGAKKLIENENENNGRNLNNRNQSVNLLDRWQKPGDIATIPKLSAIGNVLVYTSSKYVYDNSFINLSNVSLSYTLSDFITKKLRGTKITVFGNATNVFYWYKQKSPEGRNGIREYRFSFPEAQTFTWGTRIGF
jgi:TonB-dependent starch-binding outer membrane protein SusC